MKAQFPICLLVVAAGLVSGCTTPSSSVASSDPFQNQDPFQMAETKAVHAPGKSDNLWQQPDAIAESRQMNSAPDPRQTAQQAPGWSSTRHVTHPEFQTTGQTHVKTAMMSDDPFMPAISHASSEVQTADYQTAKTATQQPATEQPVFVEANTNSPAWYD